MKNIEQIEGKGKAEYATNGTTKQEDPLRFYSLVSANRVPVCFNYCIKICRK